MKVTLKVWRQKSAKAEGKFVSYEANGLNPDMSFLEMLDKVNNELEAKGDDAIAFDHDCREGICGSCGVVVNGRAHGPGSGTTTCQLYMRQFRDGDVLVLEPFRAHSFPILKDLVVDRSAFDRVIASGGYVSTNTGAAVEANAIPVPKDNAELAMDAAQCIGCGACVAACPNASAMLFVGAKVSHLALLPQGGPERIQRAAAMVEKMDGEGFGNCTNIGECESVCPKKISLANIARMNREYVRAKLLG